MRYYGDFRSIDTSVDPKGKLYRVLIFTGYDGTNPYTYTKHGGYAIPSPIPGEPGRWVSAVYVPNLGTNITLTDHPVTIEYEGDTGNIHEPYIGSTASISFLQSSFNKDLVNSNGRDVLVVILRQKDEVIQVNANQYRNTITGETINRQNIYGPTWDITEGMLLFSGFDPKQFDNFCFDVEWVGFGTPDVLSVDYSTPNDVFTLNCQDALSTLEYDKYEYINGGGIISADLAVQDIVGMLGTYRNFYLDDDVSILINVDNEWYSALSSGILQDNHFDENGEAMSKMQVLKEIMQFFGLVIIPWHDSVLITTPEKIMSGRGTYRHYLINNDNSELLNWGGAHGYTRQPTNVNLSNYLELTKDDHSGGNTQLSTENIVKKVSIEDDILTVDELSPEFDNNDNFKDLNYNNLVEMYSNVQRIWKVNEMFSAIDQIVTHQYEKDTSTYGTPSLVDPDTMSYNFPVTVTLSTTETNPRKKIYQSKDYPTCTIIDDGGTYDAGESSSGSYRRRIYFHSKGWDRRDAAVDGTIPGSYEYEQDMWTTNTSTNVHFLNHIIEKTKNQPMLEVIGKSFIGRSGLYLHIDGTFTFYGNRRANPRMYPHQYAANTNAANTTYYVYGKIRYGNRWLTNTSAPGVYTWSTTEQFVKIYYDIPSDSDCFGVAFQIKGGSGSNKKGIVVALPSITGVNNVQVTICRPAGVPNSYGTCCTACLLDNFAMNVYTERELFDTYFEGYNNLEFNSVVDDRKINEFPSLKTIYTSSENTAVNLSQVLGLQPPLGVAITLPKLCNRATGNIGVPEQVLVDELANQYGQLTLVMSTPVVEHRSKITPYTVIHWSKLNNYRFVPVKWSFDPEYDSVDVTAVSVFPHVTTDSQGNPVRSNTLSDVPRQFFRTGAVRASNRVVRRNTRGLDAGVFTPSVTISNNNDRVALTIQDSVLAANLEAAMSSVEASFGDGRMVFTVPDSVEGMTVSRNTNGHLIVEM